MLFHSFAFIGVFLPVCLAGFFLLGFFGRTRLAMAWLVLASLFFYGWWNPAYLWLIVLSVLSNYAFGQALLRFRSGRFVVLVAGVSANLAVLGYFKYANFFLSSVQAVAHTEFTLTSIALPLGISFFTFQQIAYLADAYNGTVRDPSLLDYALFVTFFPQLIAGPIVHHGEMLPQFARSETFRPTWSNIAIGLTIFMIGLCKKVVFADTVALFSSPVFAAAEHGMAPDLFSSWVGALGYALQLYFDFSGYSDMAIGSARLFGIVLPLNFYSPYRAKSIIEFWRRWHITLSNFLRDYLYIPLGGSRKGIAALCVNLFVTMLLGGLWHGAGWTFVFWGALHGAYLVINHVWRRLVGKPEHPGVARITFSWLLTFLAVTVSWVFFRAHTFAAALSILAGMFGMHAGEAGTAVLDAYTWKPAACVIAALLILVFLAPNTQQYLSAYDPSLTKETAVSRFRILRWQPSVLHACVFAVITTVALVFLVLSEQSEFLYFQF